MNEIDHASNVRFVQILYDIDGLVGQVETLFFTNVPDEFVDFHRGQLVETHTNEFMLQRQFDFADVIANEAELHIVAAHL